MGEFSGKPDFKPYDPEDMKEINHLNEGFLHKLGNLAKIANNFIQMSVLAGEIKREIAKVPRQRVEDDEEVTRIMRDVESKIYALIDKSKIAPEIKPVMRANVKETFDTMGLK